MKTLKFFILFPIVIISITFAEAQSDPHLKIEKFGNSSPFMACDQFDITYTLTVDENRDNITIQEDFPPYCYGGIDLITPLPLSGDNFTLTNVTYFYTPTSITYSIQHAEVFNNTAVQMQFRIKVYANSSGSLYYCGCCGSEPKINSAQHPAWDQEAVPLLTAQGTRTGWYLYLDPNVIVRGYHCFDFPVVVESDCPDYNLELVKLNFIAPPHAVITDVTPEPPLLDPLAAYTTFIPPNNISFYVNPGLTHDRKNIYYVRVEFPCDDPLFLDPGFYLSYQTVKVINTPMMLMNIFPLFPLSPPSCDICQPITMTDGQINPINGASFAYQPKKPVPGAFLIKSNNFTMGHDAHGCENQYTVSFINSGTTNLTNIVITDPVPVNDIEIINICDPADCSYQLNNNATWYPAPGNPSDYINITTLKWDMGSLNLRPGETIKKVVCYRIKRNCPGVIQNIVSATYSDNVDCFVPSCPLWQTQSATITYNYHFDCKDEANPGITKSVYPTVVNHDQKDLDFCILATNSGSADLFAEVEDDLPVGIENIHDVTFGEIMGTDNPDCGINGPVANITYQYIPDPTFRALKLTNIKIPGHVCTTLNIPSPPTCCAPLYNVLVIKFHADVTKCTHAGDIINTATLKNTVSNITKSSSAKITVASTQVREVSKLVKGQNDVGWTADMGHTVPGGKIDYQITITNTGNEDWAYPVIIDCLPDIGDVSICNQLPRNSQYKVTFRGTNPVKTPAILPWGLYSVNIAACAANVICDVNCCNIPYPYNPAVCPINSWAAGQPTNVDRSVMIAFSGTLKCGTSVTITLECQASVKALPGEKSCNDICFNALDHNNHKVNPNSPSPACVEIESWIHDCCPVPNFNLYHLTNEVKWDATNTYTIYNTGFNISTLPGSTLPIQEIKVSIVDFNYDQDYEDCYKCKNEAEYLGTFDGTIQDPLKGLVKQLPRGNRELIWGTGYPSLFDPGVTIPLSIKLPGPRAVPCCTGCVDMVIKFEVTDINCNTCERYIPLYVNLPVPNVTSNGSCVPTLKSKK